MLRRSLLAALVLAPASANAAGGGGGGSAAEPESTRSYIMLDTLTATITRRTGVRGVITVETGVDIADENLRARAELSRPRLRASYTEFLQSYVSGLNRGAPVNADYLAAQLQRRTDQVLGKSGAKFLIGSILMN